MKIYYANTCRICYQEKGATRLKWLLIAQLLKQGMTYMTYNDLQWPTMIYNDRTRGPENTLKIHVIIKLI